MIGEMVGVGKSLKVEREWRKNLFTKRKKKKRMVNEKEIKGQRNKCGLENKVAPEGQNGHFIFLITSVTRQRLTGGQYNFQNVKEESVLNEDI